MKNSLEDLLKKAEDGNTDAMVDLALFYVYKDFDYENALMWLKRSFEHGNHDAILEIARVYECMDIKKSKQIDGVVMDIEYSSETIEWYQKALNFYEEHYKDKTEYAFTAGELLSGEDVIEMDHEKAFGYFLYLAHLQDEEDVIVKIARRRVAQMYRLGIGCNQDLEKSKYYRSISGYDEQNVSHGVFRYYFKNEYL